MPSPQVARRQPWQHLPSPSPAGRDLTQVSAKERAAHQKAMLDAHKERFKDAYWTQTVPIIEQQKTQDVFLESPGHRINGANKKFVVPTDRPTALVWTRSTTMPPGLPDRCAVQDTGPTDPVVAHCGAE